MEGPEKSPVRRGRKTLRRYGAGGRGARRGLAVRGGVGQTVCLPVRLGWGDTDPLLLCPAFFSSFFLSQHRSASADCRRFRVRFNQPV